MPFPYGDENEIGAMHQSRDTSKKFQTMDFKNDKTIGLEKATLKAQHNMANLQCHTGDHPPPPTLPLPKPNQIVIYIGVFDLWMTFILNWIS